MALPDLQEWVVTHMLAHTQPANPQPTSTQPTSKDGASVQTTLRDSPETPLMAITLPTAEIWRGLSEPQHGGSDQLALALRPESPLGFMVAPMTEPRPVAPSGDHRWPLGLTPLCEDHAYEQTDGPVPLILMASSLKERVVVTTTTTREHSDHVCSLHTERMGSPLLSAPVIEGVCMGPGGVGNQTWCCAHGTTDPLSVPEICEYLYHSLGVSITKPVQLGSAYERFGLWDPLRVQQYVNCGAVKAVPFSVQGMVDSLRAVADSLRAATSLTRAATPRLRHTVAPVN